MSAIFSSYLVSLSGKEREPLFAYALRHGHGIEIKDFSSHWPLDNAPLGDELVRWYGPRLSQVKGPVTLHGPFGDLSLGGSDPKILAVSRERIVACLDIARRLGISHLVFHTCFNHPEPQPWYVEVWVKRHAEFWQEVLAGRDSEVFLENLWDPSPEVLRDAIDAIGLPNVGACLDVGHAHVHARISPARWVEVLGPRIRHLHLHDNAQLYDQHLVPGGGTIDWAAFAEAMRTQALCVPAVLELSGEARLTAAVRLLEQLNG